MLILLGLCLSLINVVVQLLFEEREVFAKNDSDIGNIIEFQMGINLTDGIPVNEAYLPPGICERR